MNNIFEQMLARYDIKTNEQKRNVTHEVMQEITLAGLYRGGFFDKAAFYGGTCLRIFHGLPRFSEDMDFSLIEKDEKFDLESYFPSIIEEFKAAGRDVVITRKEKKKETKVESAFLKDDTAMYDVKFKTDKDIKIKIEVDIDPPLGFITEQKLSLMPFSFMTRCFTLPDLYAGKMHALLFRNWKTRVKGRDWYDFEWYVRHNIPLDFIHFQERSKEFNSMDIDKEMFTSMLKDRLVSTEINMVKRDVLPFVQNPKELEIWSNDYFLQLANRVNFL
ncbi:putative nucleotidyltransferase component of viral defense system [Parabacteroides sp. PF5-5]|nr:putative nucleotidyltransferase component of viral defense system [Parabacteroides sp. PH5-39]MDH6314462.1 putative nucleotidyltransferase component of viral defense system [Parabacteroides sp. PF5-13]MDH6318473.1 putative nucleotidyltransferase component of viral defense system [Parabacteroides sp. PH5-13]MDH6322234.1 putative nucleotidyltransferase component of viral defense system [Parabacteroides sp. PH5-8]MDH6325686.1 putative nucleotidyltransferase component of viral defense system [Pa